VAAVKPAYREADAWTDHRPTDRAVALLARRKVGSPARQHTGNPRPTHPAATFLNRLTGERLTVTRCTG
jgi:hypothetical protein